MTEDKFIYNVTLDEAVFLREKYFHIKKKVEENTKDVALVQFEGDILDAKVDFPNDFLWFESGTLAYDSNQQALGLQYHGKTRGFQPDGDPRINSLKEVIEDHLKAYRLGQEKEQNNRNFTTDF